MNVEARKQQKHVTFFIGSLSGGGAEAVCVNLANGLVKRGWRVTLLTLNDKNSVYHDRVSSDVDFVVLNCRHAYYAYFSLRRWILQEQPQRVVAFNHGMAALMVLVRATCAHKFILYARNINTLSYKINLSQGFLRRRVINPVMFGLYQQVDHVINQCEGMRKDLVRLFPTLENKSSVIYNPVNEIFEHPKPDSQEFKDSVNRTPDYILCVGRLNEQKSFHFAVKAFAGIADEYATLRLKILGQGPKEGALRSLAAELGVEALVDFEGFQSNTKPFYEQARLTLLTSLYEGFPNVLIESITIGTPVVAFDCASGPAEIIQDGVNGRLVTYQNIDELKIALTDVLDSSEYRQESVRATAKRFSGDQILDRWETVLTDSSFN